jgi:O-antigen/teichoic acid export membrane protein
MTGNDGRSGELAKLLSSATLVLVGTVVGSAAKLVERAVVGRALSLDSYGQVSVGIAVLTIGSAVALFGFAQGVPRYVSRFDDDARVRGAWLTGVTFALGIGALIGAVLYAAAGPVGARLLDDADPALIRPFALAIPMVAGLQIGVAGIRGKENTRYRAYVNDLFYPLSRILLMVALLAAGYGVLAAGYAYLAAAAAGFVLAHAFLHRLVPLRGAVETDVGEILQFSAPLVVSSVVWTLILQTDTLMLGYFRPMSEVALYGAAYPLAYGLLLVLTAFGYVYFPMASRLDADGSRGELDAIYTVTTKWVYVLTFPAFLAFVVFPADVLTAVFGARYAPGAPALAILAFGFFANVTAGRNRQTLSALGHTNVLMLVTVGTAALNVALNLLLVPGFGDVGAAVASASAYLTLNVAVCGYLYARFAITPLSGSNVRIFVALPAVFFPVAALVSPHLTLTAVTLVPFLVVTGLLALPVVVLVGGVEPEDAATLSFVEERTGVRVPFVWRFVPDEG